jgi:hypothetical protein
MWPNLSVNTDRHRRAFGRAGWPVTFVRSSTQLSRHQIGGGLVLRVNSILGGLHHEYSLAPQLA